MSTMPKIQTYIHTEAVYCDVMIPATSFYLGCTRIVNIYFIIRSTELPYMEETKYSPCRDLYAYWSMGNAIYEWDLFTTHSNA